MNGIEKITDRILADADDFRKVSLEQAENQIADIREKYDSDSAYLLASAKAAAVRDKEEILSRARSGASMAHRRILLDRKSALIDVAYRRAEEHFLTLSDPARMDFVEKLLARAIEEHTTELSERARLYGKAEAVDAPVYTVCLAPADLRAFGQKLLPDFRQKYTRLGAAVLAKLQLAPAPGKLTGGVILRFGDIEMNCSLTMLLARHRDGGEGEVYSALFTE